MPGPGGTQQAYNIQHLPQHVNLQRGQRGPVIEQPKHYQFGKSTVTGASAGAASGGWIGAAIGAGVGLAGDVVGYFTNKKQQERANEFNKQQAAEAFAREQMAQREAAHWNSEQAQVERLKKAGLSPALAYGQMSPSTMQAANSSAASAAPMPNQDFGGAASGAEAGANAAISAQQAESLIELQSAQGAKTELERIQLEIDNITRHRQNLAGIEQQLASANLDKVTKARLEFLMQEERNQLLASIDNLKASTAHFGAQAEFISGAQTTLTNAQTVTELERPAFIRAQTATEKERPFEIRHHIDYMDSEAVYAREQANFIKQKYGVTQTKIDAICDWLESNGFPRYYVGYAMDFLDDVCSKTGSNLVNESVHTLFSWLSGDNWLSYISSRKNTKERNFTWESISDDDRDSRERIAAGHDAVSLERVERLIESGAKTHDSQRKSEFNRYRAEYHMLNDANKKRVQQRAASLEAQGVDENDAAEELAYYSHLLFQQQSSQASSGSSWWKW